MWHETRQHTHDCSLMAESVFDPPRLDTENNVIDVIQFDLAGCYPLCLPYWMSPIRNLFGSIRLFWWFRLSHHLMILRCFAWFMYGPVIKAQRTSSQFSAHQCTSTHIGTDQISRRQYTSVRIRPHWYTEHISRHKFTSVRIRIRQCSLALITHQYAAVCISTHQYTSDQVSSHQHAWAVDSPFQFI